MDRPPLVLLFNFGGPQSAKEVQPFLFEIFSDPFILKSHFLPRFLREFIAKVLSKRQAKKVLDSYEKIKFSPLNQQTEFQALKLQNILKEHYKESLPVKIINRYTSPFATEVLKNEKLDNYHLFFLSLYPHFAHSTVASSYCAFDKAWMNHYGTLDNLQSTRIYSWHHHSTFVQYLSSLIQKKIEDCKNPILLFSAHGVPERFFLRGDPYVYEIKSCFQRISSFLKKKNPLIKTYLSYQSRLGPVKWVGPHTEELIPELGREHPGQDLILIPISFTADHYETLFEMDILYKNLTYESGFSNFIRPTIGGYDPELASVLFHILSDFGIFGPELHPNIGAV